MSQSTRDLIRFAPLSLATMFVLVAGECDDDSTMTDPVPGAGTFRIVLDHTVDGEALVQNEFNYTTAEGNDFSVSKLVYVLSRVEVDSDDGDRHRRSVEGPDVHLRDAFNDASRTIEITDVPEGEYTSLEVIFGLTEEMNGPGITYTQPGLEDEWVDMDWLATWGDGYHYMKLEGRIVPEAGRGDGTVPLATHLGRRNAQNDPVHGTDPAPIPHFFPVSLVFPDAISLTDGDVYEVQVVMNVANWYTGPNDIDLDDDNQARAIMMNTSVQTMFEENGRDATLPAFSLGTVTEVGK